jgi:hypothetical protein
LFNETVPQRHIREVMNDDTQSCVSGGFERASPRNFGQLYNGRVLTGILWLIITPGLWTSMGGLLGWACHVAAYTAHNYARDHCVRAKPYRVPIVCNTRKGRRLLIVRGSVSLRGFASLLRGLTLDSHHNRTILRQVSADLIPIVVSVSFMSPGSGRSRAGEVSPELR